MNIIHKFYNRFLSEDAKLKELLFKHHKEYWKIQDEISEIEKDIYITESRDSLIEIGKLKIEGLEIEQQKLRTSFNALRDNKLNIELYDVSEDTFSAWKTIKLPGASSKVFSCNRFDRNTLVQFYKENYIEFAGLTYNSMIPKGSLITRHKETDTHINKIYKIKDNNLKPFLESALINKEKKRYNDLITSFSYSVFGEDMELTDHEFYIFTNLYRLKNNDSIIIDTIIDGRKASRKKLELFATLHKVDLII